MVSTRSEMFGYPTSRPQSTPLPAPLSPAPVLLTLLCTSWLITSTGNSDDGHTGLPGRHEHHHGLATQVWRDATRASSWALLLSHQGRFKIGIAKSRTPTLQPDCDAIREPETSVRLFFRGRYLLWVVNVPRFFVLCFCRGHS